MPTELRSKSEIQDLADLIKDNKFFRERQELQYQDIKDLASMFQFREVEQFEDVFSYGDPGDLFYLIVKGSVSV